MRRGRSHTRTSAASTISAKPGQQPRSSNAASAISRISKPSKLRASCVPALPLLMRKASIDSRGELLITDFGWPSHRRIPDPRMQRYAGLHVSGAGAPEQTQKPAFRLLSARPAFLLINSRIRRSASGIAAFGAACSRRRCWVDSTVPLRCSPESAGQTRSRWHPPSAWSAGYRSQTQARTADG